MEPSTWEQLAERTGVLHVPDGVPDMVLYEHDPANGPALVIDEDEAPRVEAPDVPMKRSA